METIFLGLSFIALGVLLKLFPNLIAGYNTLDEREKENVKTNGLPTFMLFGFIIMGVIIISGYFLSQLLEIPSLRKNLNIFVILSGAVIFIIFGQRFKN